MYLLSVLWRCRLGSRKSTRPVKIRLVGCWRGYVSGARRRLEYGPADATATHCLLSLASVKSRLVLPLWYWLTRVVPENGPLNGCVCSLHINDMAIAFTVRENAGACGHMRIFRIAPHRSYSVNGPLLLQSFQESW